MQKNKTLVNKAMKAMLVAGFAAAMFPASVYAVDVQANTYAVAAQQNQIKGTVVDEFGEPMIGVTIKVKGAQVAGITDIDGNFTLNAKEGAEIEFSYIGYLTQTLKLKSGMQVQMKPDSQMMEEVVVIGYGTMKKRDLTGAITTVKSEDITINPGTNPMEALQGKVAGLDITKSSGQAGSGVSMQLRGNRSLEASGNPLFIIDGMPGDYATLNPNDIESIEVLKDASSTAIYGSSGANGVVIITTKGGKEGKLAINFNAYLGINGWSSSPKMMNANEYVDAMRVAHKAAGDYVDDASMFGDSKQKYYENYLAGKSIDWADELLKTGITQNYSLSVSGGSEKVKAYMSLNFSDEQGQYNNDNYKVYSTNSRVEFKANNYVTIGTNIQGSYVHKNNPFAKLGDIVAKMPVGDVKDENGEYISFINDDTAYINPLINNNSNFRSQNQNFKLYVNPFIRVTPMKGLTWESRVNGTLTYSKANSFTGIGSFNFYNNGADWEQNTSASISNSRNYSYKWENIITWNHTFADAHEVTLTGVTSWNHSRNEGSLSSGTGISDNNYLWHNIAQSKTTTASSSYSMQKGMAYIVRANYSYKGRYLLSASMRWDGDSRLADGHQWSTFPAVSVGWRISDEKFMESTQSWLDNLKLRLSYGETGTAGISAYQSASSLQQGHYTLGGDYITSYNYTSNVANHNLTWERSKSFDFGLDAGFLNGRINFTMDYYLTNTDGVIWGKYLPVVNGAYNYNTLYSTKVNLAKTRNQGVELGINSRNITKKDLTWTSSLTFSYNKEKITSLAGTENDYVINGNNIYMVGYAINSYYGFKLNGTWSENEADEAAIFGKKPGDLRIEVPGLQRHNDNGSIYYTTTDDEGNEVRYDKDNQWVIAANMLNQQVLGHNSPDWSLGFKNDLAYKGFDLSIYMYMRWGQMINYNMLTNYDPQVGTNFAADYLNHIGSYFPALNSDNPRTNMTEFSSLAFVDGSFFKIKNITLGYTFPKKWLKHAAIDRLRIYGTITNPLIITKSDLIKDYDPEMNGASDYPLTKQLVFGVNLTF